MKDLAESWDRYQRYLILLPQNPKKCFQELNPLFKWATDKKDSYHAFLLWPLLIKAIIFSWDNFKKLDPYLEWYESNFPLARLEIIPEFLAFLKSNYFLALFLRKPEKQILPVLQQELLASLNQVEQQETKAEILFSISWRVFWQGDLITLALLGDELKRLTKFSPGAEITKTWIEAGKAIWVHDEFDAARSLLQKAHQLADRKEIPIWKHLLFAFEGACFLLKNKPLGAEKALNAMEASLPKTGKHALGHFLYLKGWKHFLAKDFNQADIYFKRALQVLEETGYRYPFYLTCFALSQVLFAKKEFPESLKYLKKCETFAREAKSFALLFMCSLHQAYLAYLSGDAAFGKFFLKRALSIGNRQNYIHLLWWHNPQMLSYTLAKALEGNIFPNYAKQLIIRHNLRPSPAFGNISVNWPYRLKIYTLGRFALEIELNKQKIRKTPSKPLELLAILVAAQGEVEKSYVLDILWPEIEADTAYHNLETTIYRLRKILGQKDLIKSHGRTISLDTESCYVDMWELKSKLEKIKKAITRQAGAEAFLLTEEVLDLYDEFLPGYHNPLVIYERNFLKKKTSALLIQCLEFLTKSFPKEVPFLKEKAASILGPEFSQKLAQNL